MGMLDKKSDLIYKDEVIDRIMSETKICIYGAGTMGKALYKCITESPYDMSVQCFIVCDKKGNPDHIGDVPVIELAKAAAYKEDTVLVALNGKLIQEALSDLREHGFGDIIPISFDGDAWTHIRGNWIGKNEVLPKRVERLSEVVDQKESISDAEEGSEDCATLNICINDYSDHLHIYVAHSIHDRELTNVPSDRLYEIPIQVGAALTEKRICAVTDADNKDTISEKNRQFCELTGIYHVWKSDKTDYIGFSHYRRKFMLSNKQIDYILHGEIDVIVTEPLVNFETVRGQYEKDHIIEDWNVFLQAIKSLSPEYYETALKVEKSIYYYAYNMFIMKRDVFEKYCEFIFPILMYCNEKSGCHEDIYQNRYVGFLAERLLSIFIRKNSNYKVAIADKVFIE